MQDAGLTDAVAGGGTLASVRRRGGHEELLAGPVGGPWPVLLSCPAGSAPRRRSRVLSCCGRRALRLLAFTALGQVAYDAGGRVEALASDGDRAARVAEGADGQLRVFTLAPADLASVLVGVLGSSTKEAVPSIAVAQDGRVRARV